MHIKKSSPDILSRLRKEKYYQKIAIEESQINTSCNVDTNIIAQSDAGKMYVAADTTMVDIKVKLDAMMLDYMMEKFEVEEFKFKCAVCGKATGGKDASNK